MPVNAMAFPSGAQVGFRISSTSGMGISRVREPLCASKIARAARPVVTVATAICRLVLSQAPAE
jgi:hypothetical protein